MKNIFYLTCLLIAFLVVLMNSGCGQKGDLYLDQEKIGSDTIGSDTKVVKNPDAK